MKESSLTQSSQQARLCPGCSGKGFYEVAPVGPVTCSGCGGTGKVRVASTISSA